MKFPPSPMHGWLTPLEFTLLGAIWGGSFLLMRVTAPVFGPLALVELRLAFGALVLLPFLWRAWKQLRPALGKLVMVGLLNSAAPFLLFAWAAQRAPAGIGAITNAATVLFATVFAFFMFNERLDVRRMLGLIAGFAGVAVLMADRSSGEDIALATLAGTVASGCYGLAANLARRHLACLPAAAVAAATLVCGALILLLPAMAAWPGGAGQASIQTWAAVVLLGVVCSGFAYVLYFRLIKRIGPARAVTVTYLIPLFGVAWAWALLAEPLLPSMAIAGLLILGGVALSHQHARPAAATAVPADHHRSGAGGPRQAATGLPVVLNHHLRRREPCTARPCK
jgi:drug/metabolite transporter (DMT)-like permease